MNLDINYLKRIPFYIPFNFSSIASDTRNTVTVQVPYNVAVYGITIVPSLRPPQTNVYEYNLQFQNYTTGATLFDTYIQAFNIQTDARTPFMLPSVWWINKNDRIICTLNAFSSITTGSYYVTLLGYVTGENPNPGIEPFIYSFPINIGFEDLVSGSVSTPFGQGFTGTVGKHMLRDFELCAATLDAWGTTGIFTVPATSFRISSERKGQYFDRAVINGVAIGGMDYVQNGTPELPLGGQQAANYPAYNIIQWLFPEKIRIKKGEIVRVSLLPAPILQSTNSIHSAMNNQCCMALIGNHIYG